MERTPRWWQLSRAEVLAAAAVLVATMFVLQLLAAQQQSRMALTASLAEHGTVRIDRFEDDLGLDFAEKDGHLYSDKAPAQPVLAVGPYLAYKAFGGESAEVLRIRSNLGLWWISLWSAALPAAALVPVMARLARPWMPEAALPAALAMSFGSLLLPFGTLLFSHTASALLVGAALLTWRRTPATPGTLAATGGLLAGAIAVEYTAVVALAVVGLASIVRDRWRAGWMAVGGAAPLLSVAAYHWIAFGGPLEVPYRYHNLGLHNSAAAGLTAPSPERLWTLATSGRGLFVLTPVLILALVGLVLAYRERPERRTEVGVAAAIFLGFVVVQAGAADLTGGDSLGPRYVVPALPGLVIGVASVWTRRPALCLGVALLSTTLMVLGTYTNPIVSVDVTNIFAFWLDLLRAGDLVDTLLDPILGPAAIPVILAASALLAHSAVAADRADQLTPPRGAPASDP